MLYRTKLNGEPATVLFNEAYRGEDRKKDMTVVDRKNGKFQWFPFSTVEKVIATGGEFFVDEGLLIEIEGS